MTQGRPLTKIDRDARLNLRISSDVYARLERLGEQMGIPAATLGAVAIGEYVNKLEVNQNLMKSVATGLVDSFATLIEGQLNDEGAQARLASALAASLPHKSA